MNGGVTIPDKDTARALNDLARHKAIVRILSDIRMDMEICEIEGWDKNEYLNLIRQLLNSIGGDKTMDDSIGRQVAIDAVDAIGHIATMPDGDKCIRRSAVKYTLSMLPSAQPEERTEKRTKTHVCDLISRQAAIDAIHCDITVTGKQNAELVASTIGAFVDRIKALPSAQPEIIHCKDCRFNVSSHKCLHPESFFLVPSDDFYCGYAERRTDETD